ncbi:shikimate dehydrogenase [Corynebacterium liangguodongii]|uniref:Shikimate dehydrogenase n=1 Tax=Corynebacterium liangguodongii TaxID=2079535 RepID=A0A2S0WEA5_9CORY|nr:shikimate dehydrogenase [Corynebacterium liangguodongii]AWB84101.1 shikimate dehydrogenase [Corynebacterium liangguodongii]PWC00112.1 shikimate dehydrogenase [Corynebacterium liangguodongii]
MTTRYRAAVLGSPIEHSLSPVLHNAGYAAAGLDEWDYTRIECTAADLPAIVGGADESYRGFSVTMPAKFAALDFATEATERAAAIGAANTLVRTPGGWRADNTDCEGISGALDALLAGAPIGRALVIGAGGTARPALWALGERGVGRIDVLNRSDRSAEIAPLVRGAETTFSGFDADLYGLAVAADVIISTVPAPALRDYADALGHAPVLDVIYEPWPTPLAIAAAANGYTSVGGLVMLAEQSFSQFEQFTGVAAPRQAMREALARHTG